METYTTEEQQIEDIKKWWAENGLPIGLGIVIGLGGIFGWRGWLTHQSEMAQAASGVYESMIASARSDEIEQAKTQAEKLLSDYDSTTYASYAAMLIAKIAVDDGDLATAREQLQLASSKAKTKELKLLAQLRLARIELADGKPEQALTIFANNDFSGFGSAGAELKGDIYAAKGDLETAGNEYTVALEKTRAGSEQFKILEMKLDSVGRQIN